MQSTSIIDTDFMNIPRLCIISAFKITTKTISLKLIQLIFLTQSTFLFVFQTKYKVYILIPFDKK